VCPHCTRPVALTDLGRVAPHRLTEYSALGCRGEGREPLLSTQETGAERPGQRPRPESAEDLPAPTWLPPWEQRYLASVALPASGPVRLWLPYTTSLGHIAAIDTMMPTATRPIWDPRHKCWTIPKGHFLMLAGKLLRRYGHLALGREYSPRERCNARCKNARGPYCTCSCRAKYHGRGRWMKDFVTLSESGTTYERRSWHWRIVASSP
jgi:hypothetical protein